MSQMIGSLTGFFILLVAGVLAAILVAERNQARWLSVIGRVSSLFIIWAGIYGLLSDQRFTVTYWPRSPLGALVVGINSFSGLFLLITGLVAFAVSAFSDAYLPYYRKRYSLCYFALLYYGFLGSIVWILIAQDVFSFLLAWEAMTVVSYLLTAYESDNHESAPAALVLLILSEVGMIATALAFLLLSGSVGSFQFSTIQGGHRSIAPDIANAVFLLSFAGFAVKAGILPLNGWLPRAHPVAPTNISALLSAVVVNLGIYGICLVNLELLPVRTLWSGTLMLAIGSVTGLVGILYATTETELKRLLAHSTIENMGVVLSGIGAGTTFMVAGQPIFASLAFVAAFYHLGNHSFYKTLLFLGVGAVYDGTGTRDLDRLGGLIHAMPRTSTLFLIGVLGITALPPLNGFVSEWLTLQAVLRAASFNPSLIKLVFAISGALLALTAGLAITCFFKVFAMGFLGIPRSSQAASATEAPRGMELPMRFLAAICIALGILPTYVISLLDKAIEPITGMSAASALVPPFFRVGKGGGEGLPAQFVRSFHDLGAQIGQHLLPGRGLVILLRGGAANPVVFAMSTSYGVIAFAVLLFGAYLIFKVLTRNRSVAKQPAWDGGLRQLSPNLTYTATGFASPVRVLFRAVLRPTLVEERSEEAPEHFVPSVRRTEVEIHVVDRLLLRPAVLLLSKSANVARRMHNGEINSYASYVLATLLLVLLIWGIAR